MIGSRPALFPVWHLAGWTMLHFICAGSLVAVWAALGRQILRRAHPDVRYACALASLTLLAAAPAVSSPPCLPPVRLGPCSSLGLAGGLLLLPTLLGILVLHANRRVTAQERNPAAVGKTSGKKVVMSSHSEEPKE